MDTDNCGDCGGRRGRRRRRGRGISGDGSGKRKPRDPHARLFVILLGDKFVSCAISEF